MKPIILAVNLNRMEVVAGCIVYLCVICCFRISVVHQRGNFPTFLLSKTIQASITILDSTRWFRMQKHTYGCCDISAIIANFVSLLDSDSNAITLLVVPTRRVIWGVNHCDTDDVVNFVGCKIYNQRNYKNRVATGRKKQIKTLITNDDSFSATKSRPQFDSIGKKAWNSSYAR